MPRTPPDQAVTQFPHSPLARNDVQLQTMCAAINLRRALALGLG